MNNNDSLALTNELVNLSEDQLRDASSLRGWRTALRNVPQQESFPGTFFWPSLPVDAQASIAQPTIIAAIVSS